MILFVEAVLFEMFTTAVGGGQVSPFMGLVGVACTLHIYLCVPFLVAVLLHVHYTCIKCMCCFSFGCLGCMYITDVLCVLFLLVVLVVCTLQMYLCVLFLLVVLVACSLHMCTVFVCSFACLGCMYITDVFMCSFTFGCLGCMYLTDVFRVCKLLKKLKSIISTMKKSLIAIFQVYSNLQIGY